MRWFSLKKWVNFVDSMNKNCRECQVHVFWGGFEISPKGRLKMSGLYPFVFVMLKRDIEQTLYILYDSLQIYGTGYHSCMYHRTIKCCLLSSYSSIDLPNIYLYYLLFYSRNWCEIWRNIWGHNPSCSSGFPRYSSIHVSLRSRYCSTLEIFRLFKTLRWVTFFTLMWFLVLQPWFKKKPFEKRTLGI